MLRLRRQRQPYGKGRALARRGLDVDLAAVGRYQRGHDGQAEPGAAAAPASGTSRPGRTARTPGRLLRVEARALVGDTDECPGRPSALWW